MLGRYLEHAPKPSRADAGIGVTGCSWLAGWMPEPVSTHARNRRRNWWMPGELLGLYP